MATRHKQPHSHGNMLSVRCAIVTASDTHTEETDKSGQLMQSLLAAAGHRIMHYEIIKDEPVQIAALVKRLANSAEVQAI